LHGAAFWTNSCKEPAERIGPMRSAAWLRAAASLPIWSCSVWGLPCLLHYCRSGALLPHLFTLTGTRRPGLRPSGQRSVPKTGPWVPLVPRIRGPGKTLFPAVCFLWHWPSAGLNARVPDVIRHTALRSSDFPPPASRACAQLSGSDRPVLLPVFSLPRNALHQLR